MANDPNQDGYKDYTDEQLAQLPGAPKRGANGGYVYGWRPQEYQDVLGENDVRQQQDLTNYRNQYGTALTADDDKGALAQMSGQAPLAGTNTYAPAGGAMQSWLGSQTSTQAGTTPPPPPVDVAGILAKNANPQRDDLYNTLVQRSNQSLALDPNDPIIAAQVNAYRAEQQRAARNAIDAQAESGGPYSNLNSERRLAMEQAGQNTGSFQATLLQNELTARRNEIAQALESRAGMLSDQEKMDLQRQLSELDAMIQQRGQDIGFNLSSTGLNNDLLRTLLQNQQFGQNLQSQNDQFAAQLGFNTADRSAYYDALRRGLLG